jgi:uracil-DNA glycosylase
VPGIWDIAYLSLVILELVGKFIGQLKRNSHQLSGVFMASRMADKNFQRDQWEHRFDSHVAPFNHFVDELRKDDNRGWAPYIAPMHGGTYARLLTVLQDPGPGTQDQIGSGFLCIENNDPTAINLDNIFKQHRIAVNDLLPWNSYPWYINSQKPPNVDQRRAGTKPLKIVVDLLPRLRVVVLLGVYAHDSWKRLETAYPGLAQKRGLRVIHTYHASPQALRHPDPLERQRRKQNLEDAFQEASRILYGP